MKLKLICAAVTMLAAYQCQANEVTAVWKEDFKHQVLSARPKIEARYADAERVGFDIDAERYRLLIDLKSDTGQKVRSLAISDQKNAANILAASGIYLELTDATGVTYSSLNSKGASRVNIYRRGPYYIETHWLDVQLADKNGKEAPIKGEVVFYSYPEKTHIGVILHMTGDIEVKSAALVCSFDAQTCSSKAEEQPAKGMLLNHFCLINRENNAPTCALIYPVARGVDEVAIEKTDRSLQVSNFIYSSESHSSANAVWKAGEKHTSYFEIFPLPQGEVSPEMEAEVIPLLTGSMAAQSGKTLGYDPIRGCYKVQTDSAGNFSHHYYQNPNDYEVAKFSIQNSDLARKVYILHETAANPGSVECGVVLDEEDNTLPVTVQISKNFSGEVEEPFYNPKDTPFSETIFPLYLEPSETRKLTSLHLYQNWGTHPLKQFSSLGAWMDYYHMSTGVTETTCYVPFLFGGLDGVSIADFRPMSQRMWSSQPQHDNIAGHSFLRYQDSKGTWHYVEYTGTTFRSTGPNWADMSMSYISDDGKAKVTIDVFELPQTDELRNFIHMRVDFTGDISIKDGDLARNLRILNIASWVQGMRYTTLAYGSVADKAKIKTIQLNDDFTVAGAQLDKENSFAAAYPDNKGANAYIIRSFEGKIGGKDALPGVSLIGQADGNTILMLVPAGSAQEIKAGDYLDINLMLMPYGGGNQDEKPAKKAAYDYGINSPVVTSVTAGKKISDFPTRVSVDENGRAEFSIKGGMDCIPVIVEGAKDYRYLRLYNTDNGKTLINLARKGEKDGYQVFAKSDGTYGFVFLVNADGKEHKYLAQ